MLEKLQMYINGEWVDSHSTETIEVMNPSDDSVLGVITAGNSDDVDDAVAAAKTAFVDFSFSTKEERVQILENIIAEYEKRSEELAETISKEMGAPIWLSQVAQVASGLTHFKDTLNVLKNYELIPFIPLYLLHMNTITPIAISTPIATPTLIATPTPVIEYEYLPTPISTPTEMSLNKSKKLMEKFKSLKSENISSRCKDILRLLETKSVTKSVNQVLRDLDNMGNSFDNSVKYDSEQKEFIKKQILDIAQ